MIATELLRADRLIIHAPGGRPLFRDLSMTLDRGERVAILGRNGVGKSTLLRVLAGEDEPERGRLIVRGRRAWVPQGTLDLDAARASLGPSSAARLSPGERRYDRLRVACASRSDLLLLDEPTQDLDRDALDWLLRALRSWTGAMIVVSHDRRLLRLFDDFFLVSESGSRHFAGSFETLLETLEREQGAEQLRYMRNLQRLEERERQNDRVRRRRLRKKNLGRIHELRRCPSRARLNENRSYAQESQGKRAVLQRERIEAARLWAKATRRALDVKLALELPTPTLPRDTGGPIVELDGVAAFAGERPLFEELSLRFGRERRAIVGPNGAGKSTLASIVLGDRAPDRGRAWRQRSRIGYIGQNAENWLLDECLIELLETRSRVRELEEAARLLQAHRFPFALAERPLSSLSPGERLRAALIALFERDPAPELLLLDEPTEHLDFLAVDALEEALRRWPGGLLVISHDERFLDAIGLEGSRIDLGRQTPRAAPRIEPGRQS